MTVYQICLLHSRADRVLRTIVADQLREIQITMMQWLLLGVLSNAPKQGFSMGEIAARLNITLPQVTALFTSLTKRRFVKLKTPHDDRRSRLALLTAKGEESLHKATQQIETSLKEVFPTNKRLAYASLLEHIIPGETESEMVNITMKN